MADDLFRFVVHHRLPFFFSLLCSWLLATNISVVCFELKLPLSRLESVVLLRVGPPRFGFFSVSELPWRSPRLATNHLPPHSPAFRPVIQAFCGFFF